MKRVKVLTLQVGHKTIAAVLVVIAAILVLASYQFRLPLIGGFLVVADLLEPADAIVVLGGGGRERVKYGARLFESDYAPWFIVTNNRVNIPGIRVEYAELLD